MRVLKITFVVVALAVMAGPVRLSAQLGQVFPNTPDVQQAIQVLEAKAPFDECWAGLYSGIAQFTNPNTANPPCSDVFPPAPSVPVQPKVNQGYIWGLTETSTHAWFGTFANGQCVTQAGVVSDPQPFVTDAYVCEFGASPYYPTPLTSPLIGDFRPARGYSWHKVNKTVTDVTPRKPGPPGVGFTTATNPEGVFPLWNSARGIRAATTVNSPVGPLAIMAGPSIDPTRGLVFFAWNATTGQFLGGRPLLGYSNIRHFSTVDGVLYAGVGKNQCSGTPPNQVCEATVIGGRVLRLTILPTATCSTAFPPPPPPPPPAPPIPPPNIWNPASPCFTLAIQEVGNLDSVGAYITKHEGRLFVTTWPEESIAAGSRAALFMSPVVPVGGLTTANAAQWEKVWTADDYEPDPVTALTYAGGAIASFDGYLYWGSMHIPWQAFGAFLKAHCPDQVVEPEPFPCSEEQVKQALAGTMRSVSIFRGRNFGEAREIDLVYGDESLPVFDTTVGTPGTWTTKPNKMGTASLFGPSGFGNIWNTYTWTMNVWNNMLYIGTMDWAFLSKMGSELISSTLPPELYSFVKFGGDLMYIPAANSPAYPESSNGNGNPTSYGIRTMVPGGGALGPNMTLGMANPMNLLTDPADPHGFGGLGGWELIQLKPSGLQNTAAGSNVLVNLANGVTVNYCNVARPGNTVSGYLENPFTDSEIAKEWWLQRYDLDGPDETIAAAPTAKQLIYLASTADWRTGCASPTLATVCVPRPAGLSIPRLFELTWTGTNYDWVDITTSAGEAEVCGGATQKNVGAFLFGDIQVNVELSPANAIVRPGTQQTLTATVKNPLSEVVAGVEVNFSVAGANAGVTGSGVSDANGKVTFSYNDASAPPYPKIDTVTASAGANSRQTDVIWVLRCDADSDKDIDATDVNLIRLANGKPVSSRYDPRDGNGDQLINSADYQYCRLRLGQ